MSIAILLALLVTPCLAVTPVKNKSSTNSYIVQAVSIEALETLIDLADPNLEQCVVDYANTLLVCQHMSNGELITVLEADKFVSELDADSYQVVETTSISTSSRKRRDVPWNLDRLNTMKLDLDNSFMDNADVDVYILGSGITQDHSEFGNRVHATSFTGSDGSDCDGSGTMYASLVGGVSLGIARKAQLHSVQVITCIGNKQEITLFAFTKGVTFIEESIKKSGRRSVVFVGFTRETKEERFNKQLIRLSEMGAAGGVLVVVAAGDNKQDELDACESTPASAKGESAISGVITIGAIDEEDSIISNIGECVDVFAPGYEVPAAGKDSPTARTTCTGSLCAAALAAGVAAAHLRENNKIDLETQKAMLINGATVTDLGLPASNGKYARTLLKAQTPNRVLHYTCGYYRNPALPECKIYTAECNMNKFTTFDGVGDGHLYKQADKDCDFEVFTNEDASLVITSSHYDSTLGSYVVSMASRQIELLPGPKVVVEGKDISDLITNTDGSLMIYQDEGIVEIYHEVTEDQYKHPTIVVELLEHKIKLTYDCNSMLVIKLLSISQYNGKTGGLCGLYDGIGRNDYKLKDGTTLEKYTEEFHTSWQKKCTVKEDDVDEPGCKKEAEVVCNSKFSSKSAEACFVNENMYKEKEACVAEMTKCCGCNKKATGWEEMCCKDSYFGKLEESKKGCFICDTPHCKNETVHDNCVASSYDTSYDYMDTRTYSPKSCCYSIEKDDVQECMAPKSAALMWDKPTPACPIKKCSAPELPNGYTYVTPNKTEYDCGESITVGCEVCYKVPATVLTCTSTCEDNYNNTAVWDKVVPACVEKECSDPGLPLVNNDKGLSGLSWIKGEKKTKCADDIQFKCDICYTMDGDDTITCTESEDWEARNPSCKLRSCKDPAKSLTEHLEIDIPNHKCNDTITYDCNDKCWKLHGDSSRTCKVGDDLSIGWNLPQPECKIKHCPALTDGDIDGKGWYNWTNAEGIETKVDLTGADLTYTKVNECGAAVKAVCDKCHFMSGSEYRGCVVDGSEDEPQWNGTKPTCQKKKCLPIVNDPNETHASQTSPAPYDGIQYYCQDPVDMECNECYEYASGDKTRVCTDTSVEETFSSKAAFDGEQYKCSIKNCDALSPPANGTVVTPNTECGKTVEFKCNKCYRTIGETELDCQDDKEWSGVPPTCELWKCPARTVPDNATFTKYSDNCGEGIDYECKDCYYMKGEKSSRCLEGGNLDMDGKWDIEAPTCHKYICDKLTAPDNGNITINKFECSQSTVFECDDCYTLIGEDTTTCQAGDKWSKTVATWSNERPTCQMKTCVAPEIPAHTYVVESKEEYNCGATIEVHCPYCYELGVKTTLTCNGDNNWSGEVPACTIIQCPMPALPKIDLKIHTVEIDTGNPIIYSSYTKDPVLICDKNVTYECDKCYTMRGNDTITCHDDETWDSIPSCELKRCDTPVMTDHLEIKFDATKTEYPDEYFCRDRVDYRCDDKCYALNGIGYQACVPDGDKVKSMWSPVEQSYCTIKKCPAIEPFEHGSISENMTDCGTKLTYSCKPCYRLVGSAERECNSSSEWSTPPPTCESVCCPALPVYTESNYFDVGEVANADERDLTYASYKYTYSGEKIEGCGKEHVCQEAEVTCNDCWEYKNEKGQSLPSPPSRECKHPESGEGEGYWTNLDKVCSRKTCPPRTPIKELHHANYTQTYMKDAVNCNDKVEWECESCYENKKETEMEQSCLSNKQWSAVIPVCDLKECGELPVVDHCHFPETNGTCGMKTKLNCSSCYCTENCEDVTDTEIISVQCKTNKEWQWRVKKPEVTIKTCPVPAKIANAILTTNVVEGEDYTCGRSIRYHCEECFKMKEERDCDCSELTCSGKGDTCCAGSWEGEWPTCVPMVCPVLPLPEHAKPVKSENGCKMSTKFECEKGYVLVDGDLERMCTTSETWTGKQPVCKIKNCTKLEHPANGRVSSLDYHYGTEVEFTCNDCYELPQSMTDDSFQDGSYDYGHRYNFLRCEWTGNWNGSVPACSKKSCGHPGVINNGILTDTKFSCGDSIGYQCDKGHRAVSGSTIRTCGNNKKWSGEETVCQVVDCGVPGKNDHSTVHTNITTYLGQTKYDCHKCYSTSDETVVTCLASGKWEHPAPTCHLIQCDSKTKPANGAISFVKPLGHEACGQVMRFNCDVGFTLRGDGSTICQSTGEWYKYTHPTCERNCCSEPKLDNGEINKLDGSICYQDRVEYECDECYSLVGGDARRTCEASKAWSGEEPMCRLRKCDTSHQLEHGTQSGSNKCGEKRSYFCNEGYIIDGAKDLTCLSSGKWSGEYPICKPILCDCSDLGIAKGFNNYEGQTCSIWTEIIYGCDAGYEMKGSSDNMLCRDDGTWSEEKPKCIIDKCVEPPAPDHGSVTWSSLKEGGRATYDCHSCYKMDGYTVADCSDGEWSNPAPVCTEVKCQRPGVPQFAEPMADQESYSCNATISYQCIENHKLHGDAVRVCGSDGKWNSSTPTCSNLTCPALAQPKDGTITPLNTGEGTKMEFTCNKGFQQYGSAVRECYKGQWSGVDAYCKIQNCGDPGTPSYGERSGDSFEYKDVVTFTCDYGYQISGDSDRKCQHDGTWSKIQPECRCNKCHMLTEVPNGRIMETVANTWNSSVTYSCDKGYNLAGGNETRQCLASGNWSGEAPRCEKLKCGDPYIPEKGVILREGGSHFGDTIEISCKDNKYKTVCADNGEWSFFEDDIDAKCGCTTVTKWVFETRKTVTPGQCIMGTCYPDTTTEKQVKVQREVCE